MRILYFTRADTPHDRRFLTALAGSGHEIWALRLERASVRAEVPAGVKTAVWEGIPAPADLEEALAAAPALAEVIATVQPDLIHAGPVQLAAAAAARVGFHPLLAMSWGSDLLVDAGRDESWRAATLEALRGADWLACDNLAVAEKAAALGFPGERITRFAWGVNLAHFSPGGGEAVRERLDWQQAFILLSLRAWEPLYGVDVVARAFVRAAQRRPDLRLILAGEGSGAAELRGILEEGGVLDRVAFPGTIPLENLPAYYRAADLYLSASHSDGSSVSLMEALACGLPAAVSDIPGNREWVAPGAQGWRFPDGDDRALAESILAAAADRADLQRMSRAACEKAVESADWQKNFAVLLRTYDQAVHFSSSSRITVHE